MVRATYTTEPLHRTHRTHRTASEYVNTTRPSDSAEAIASFPSVRFRDKYTSDKDLVSMVTLGNPLKAGVLLFVGLKDVLYRPWPKDATGTAVHP